MQNQDEIKEENYDDMQDEQEYYEILQEEKQDLEEEKQQNLLLEESLKAEKKLYRKVKKIRNVKNLKFRNRNTEQQKTIKSQLMKIRQERPIADEKRPLL